MPDSTASLAGTQAKPDLITTEPNSKEFDARLALTRRFPTAHVLRARARRIAPKFAFEYLDGGAGADGNIDHNWAALDAVKLVPRYGLVEHPPPASTELFGRTYSVPVGISPVGGPSTVLPGAERYLAAAAQAARVPYTLGVVSALPVEDAAALAPDVLWFQLYRYAKNEHKIGFDLMRRAEAAGVHVLVLTIDTPVRTTRPREMQAGIISPFRMTPRFYWDVLTSPQWMSELIRNGMPRFGNLAPYIGGGKNPTIAEGAAFQRREGGGAFTWDEIARYREKWKRPLLIKGVLHPRDAERAVELGIDGMFITNHGGRQIDALPATIDVLPAIASAVGSKATLILDSGIRSGADVARAIALGADAAFAGKAFLWSLAAIGRRGPAHLINLMTEELRAALGQLGCHAVSELRDLEVRHPGAYGDAEFPCLTD